MSILPLLGFSNFTDQIPRGLPSPSWSLSIQINICDPFKGGPTIVGSDNKSVT